jgi:hypothetical protein
LPNSAPKNRTRKKKGRAREQGEDWDERKLEKMKMNDRESKRDGCKN